MSRCDHRNGWKARQAVGTPPSGRLVSPEPVVWQPVSQTAVASSAQHSAIDSILPRQLRCLNSRLAVFEDLRLALRSAGSSRLIDRDLWGAGRLSNAEQEPKAPQ